MATTTSGTVAATTLTSLQWTPGSAVADIQSIAALIFSDGSPAMAGGSSQNNQSVSFNQAGSQGPWPGAFINNGKLYVPHRGWLQLLPNDWVAVDNTGWPILLSKLSAGPGGSGNWRHS
jgi:hypothetical protein